jgi:methionine biosynthesis protein MetW
MKPKYHRTTYNPELLEYDNIDKQALYAVSKKSRVLDVGCATGFMGEWLKNARDCEVVGVDIDIEEIRLARGVLNEVIHGSIEDTKVINSLIKHYTYFDTILMTSVLEHLVNPLHTLHQLKKLMTKNSTIIISTPNVAHWSIRLHLLSGKFDYTDYGILDKTHLHFYTVKTFHELINESGLTIEAIKFDFGGGGYPRIMRQLGRFFPNLAAYQILCIAKL